MTSPAGLEAEQSLLGGLLVDNAAFAAVSAIVSAADFSHGPYRAAFAAIGEVVAAHEVADPLTVFEALQRAGKAQTDTWAHLNELAASVPSASGAARYAQAVADRAQRRRTLAIADEAAEVVLSADTADAAIDALQAKLGSLKRPSATRGPRPIGAVAREFVAELNDIASGERAAGWSTGLPSLDKALGGGLKPGRVYVLAGRTSGGKTSLACQILLHAGQCGHQGLLLSQEMQAAELLGRAFANRGRVRMDALATAELDPAEWAEVPRVCDELAALPVWIDDQPALRLVDIAAKAREVQRQHGLCVLAVDYLQLCAAEPVKGQSRHHQIEAISRGIKALAKELGVAVLLLSQLNRSAEDGEPELWHLKESGAVEEDADAVLLLFGAGNEPDGRQVVCCKVAKNRGGKRGRLALAFDGKHQHWAPSSANVSRRSQGATT